MRKPIINDILLLQTTKKREMIMMKNLCLFDLDGTLTDPKVGITKSYQYALSAFGIDVKLDDLTRFIGPPLRDVFKEFYGFGTSDVEKAVIKFREYFSTTGLLENDVYPEIREILEKLKECGVIMAVATSKATLYTNRILEHFKIDEYFSFVSGDEMDGSLTKNGKRDIIRIAMDVLDAEREKSAVMIGDRKHDIIGAREVGIDCIGVSWGYGSLDELEQAQATWIACSPDEMLRYIIYD